MNTTFQVLHRDEFALKKQHKWLLFPSDRFTVAWDLLMWVYLLFALLFVTFELSFMRRKHMALYALEWTTTVVFVLDILVNFNRARVNRRNKLIVSRAQIARDYLKCWFWADFVAAFLFFLLVSELSQDIGDSPDATKFASMIKLLRFLKMLRILTRKIRSRQPHLRVRNKCQNLILNFMLATLLGHLFTCAFYAIPWNFSSTNWVTERALDQQPEPKMYLFSLHWMVETAITVGYGENPVT